MLIREKKRSSYLTSLNTKLTKNYKVFLYFIISIQSVFILLSLILLVPHWAGFYSVDSEYNRQNTIVKKIISLVYISKSIISSTKLKLGLMEIDLNVKINPSNYAELMNLRSDAFKSKKESYGRVINKNTNDKKFKKYFKANFISSNRNVEGQLRLKGDMFPHYSPSKWSMRIKLKNNSILGMSYFNLQHPQRRSLLSSYIMHLFTKYENLPTKRIGLVTVAVNNNPLGLYMYEEIPTKEAYFNAYGTEKLPIFFNDDIYMDEGLGKYFHMQNEYYTANISTYNLNKILSNPILKNDFENASNLLNNLRRKKIKALDVFDKKTATFLALVDLFGAIHTLGFNARYYYDKSTKKLTPTLWDGFSENNAFVGGVNYGCGDRNFSLQICKKNRKFLLNDLFKDKEFLELYLKKINQFTNDDYINKVFKFYKKDIENYLEKLLAFYPQASIDTEINRLKQNVAYLNKTYFEVENPVIIYRSKSNFTNNLIVVNRKPYPIYINKLVNKKSNKIYDVITNENSLLIEGKHYEDVIKPVEISFNCGKADCFQDVDVNNFEVLITKMGQRKPQLIKIKNIKFDTSDD